MIRRQMNNMSGLKEMIQISNDMANGIMTSWEEWKQDIIEKFNEEPDEPKESVWFSYN